MPRTAAGQVHVLYCGRMHYDALRVRGEAQPFTPAARPQQQQQQQRRPQWGKQGQHKHQKHKHKHAQPSRHSGGSQCQGGQKWQNKHKGGRW